MNLRDSWNLLPDWMKGHKMSFCEAVDLNQSSGLLEDDVESKYYESSFADANLITSRTQNPKFHRAILDIDIPVKIIESSSGNSHLYIDCLMTWDAYKELLTVMAKCGILEAGFAEGSKKRGFSALRLPHIKKNAPGGVQPGPNERKEIVP